MTGSGSGVTAITGGGCGATTTTAGAGAGAGTGAGGGAATAAAAADAPHDAGTLYSRACGLSVKPLEAGRGAVTTTAAGRGGGDQSTTAPGSGALSWEPPPPLLPPTAAPVKEAADDAIELGATSNSSSTFGFSVTCGHVLSDMARVATRLTTGRGVMVAGGPPHSRCISGLDHVEYVCAAPDVTSPASARLPLRVVAVCRAQRPSCSGSSCFACPTGLLTRMHVGLLERGFCGV
jgi:hypothetical protein